MKYNDMHVHTVSSPDADLPAVTLCEMARTMPVERLGFVAHLDMHPLDFCHGGFDERGFLEELDEAGSDGGPEVLRGLEIGEPHIYMEQALELFHRERYDFITGALHWVGNELILDEGPFLERNDPRELVEEYYRETLSLVSESDVNILAHLGIFRRGMARAGLSVDLDETVLFPGLLKRILTAMLERGMALEVNTAGLRRPEKTTYPAAPVLRMYRSMGGEVVTLGSDTHKKGNAFFGLSVGASLLADCGFTDAGYFQSGVYRRNPLQCL